MLDNAIGHAGVSRGISWFENRHQRVMENGRLLKKRRLEISFVHACIYAADDSNYQSIFVPRSESWGLFREMSWCKKRRQRTNRNRQRIRSAARVKKKPPRDLCARVYIYAAGNNNRRSIFVPRSKSWGTLFFFVPYLQTRNTPRR